MPRDHVFISYATEDWQLAEWLALKLTLEGYKVWCDRFNLLGGEPYPKEIDIAIKERSHCVVALLSRHSVHKPNPRKERTLALNLARELGYDFLIPLNVDGLSPTELDWMTSDLSYISFHRSWTEGLNQLLKKLSGIGTPRVVAHPHRVVTSVVHAMEQPIAKNELIQSNLFPILSLPKVISYYTGDRALSTENLGQWPAYKWQNGYWSFCMPPNDSGLVRKRQVSWPDVHLVDRLPMTNVVTYLIRRSIELYCLAKGLKAGPGFMYFPHGLLDQDRIHYRRYDGRKSHLKAVSVRTFSTRSGRTSIRYHLAPVFKPVITRFAQPIVKVWIRVHLEPLDGKPLSPAVSLRRRKRIVRNWWNDEWLNRILAVVSWIAGGRDEIQIPTSHGEIRIAASPLSWRVGVGIDERDGAHPPFPRFEELDHA